MSRSRTEAPSFISQPHTAAAAVAVLSIAAMVTAGSLYAWREEKRYLHALASAPLPQKTLGRALQVAASASRICWSCTGAPSS